MSKLNWDRVRRENIVRRSKKLQIKEDYENRQPKQKRPDTSKNYNKKVYEPKVLALLEDEKLMERIDLRTKNELKLILGRIRRGYMTNCDRDNVNRMLSGEIIMINYMT